MESNYDKQALNARGLFLGYDQEAIIEKFGLEHDEAYLYLAFIGDRCRISRQTGAVEALTEAGEFEACNQFNVVMSIYDALCYPEKTPQLSGQWCPLYSLQVTMSSPDSELFHQGYADAFAGNADRLWRACRELGAVPLPLSAGADVCCRIEIFPFFPILFRFWDADDEFPAKIQILWDRNSLQFLHFETLYYVMGPLLSKLKRLYYSIP